MPATKPKLRDDVTLVEVSEEAVLYDPRSGLLHYLNPMAALVLKLCDGTARVTETINDLAEAYEIEPEEIAPRVRGLVGQFRKLGLVVPSRGADALLAAAEDKRRTVRREVPRSD